jgi:hypothetical protein
MAAPAKDLYDSRLFRRRRSYAERRGRRWFILSALYGLVDPDAIIEPYDLALKEVSARERSSWGERVVGQLEERVGSLKGLVFEVHAGAEYVRAIEVLLSRKGALTSLPLVGLRIGEQLHWYGSQS